MQAIFNSRPWTQTMIPLIPVLIKIASSPAVQSVLLSALASIIATTKEKAKKK